MADAWAPAHSHPTVGRHPAADAAVSRLLSPPRTSQLRLANIAAGTQPSTDALRVSKPDQDVGPEPPDDLDEQQYSLARARSRLSLFDVARLATLVYGVVKFRRPVVERTPEEARQAALQMSKSSFAFFSNSSAHRICKEFAVDPAVGLSSEEARQRLAIHGPNELPKDGRTPWWRLFLEQFSDILVLLLCAAAIVSLGLGDYESAVAILVVILLNAILGVVQESKAEAALEALESLSEPTSTVVRDGVVVEVQSREIVPGDVIILETGKRISADIRLMETQELQCGEMALTGESEGVRKDAKHVGTSRVKKALLRHVRSLSAGQGAAPPQPVAGQPVSPIQSASPQDRSPVSGKMEARQGEGMAKPAEEPKKKEEELTERNMAYMGCIVLDGRARGVVVKTGSLTKMGEIAHLLKTADKGVSPLQVKLHKLGTKLGIASLFCSVIVFIIGVTLDRGTDPTSSQPVWLQMLLVAVSLTVASVPEGLPVCVTITLAIGMRNMVKKHALIRNLRSVETLGSASVICTDKTGTLTKGVMTAVRVWTGGTTFTVSGAGYDPVGDIVALDGQSAGAGDAHRLPLLFGLLASNATLQYIDETKTWEAKGSMTERPIVVVAKKGGLDRSEVFQILPRIKENPFNSTRKTASFIYDLTKAPSDFKQKYLLDPQGLSQLSTAASSSSLSPTRPGKAEGDFDAGPSDTRSTGSASMLAVVAGAPNNVLHKCTRALWGSPSGVVNLTPELAAQITSVIDGFSAQALRVIAVAYRPIEGTSVDSEGSKTSASSALMPEQVERQLIFAGLFASMDPERPEVAPSIEKAAHAGIRCVMITGDYVKTAKAIAENIRLLPRGSPDAKAVDCQVVRDLGTEIDAISAQIEAAPNAADKTRLIAERETLYDRLDQITSYADVYARAKPVDKITIVRSLQRQGHICSMTGDGVNDAPALKQANIGVAMGVTGTDVAKAASDMVLTDDNFVSIVEAIEQGRTIYANIQKFVFYFLSTNISEVMVILIPVIIGTPTPLSAIQILFLNLTTDAFPAIALAMEPTEPGIMQEGPRPAKESLLDRLMLVGILVHNIVLTGLGILTWLIALHWETGSWVGDNSDNVPESEFRDSIHRAQTVLLIFIVFAELLRAFTCRALRTSVFQQGLLSNRVMIYSVVGSIAITVFVALIPGLQRVIDMRYIYVWEWVWAVGMAFIPAIVDEIMKLIYRCTGFGKRPIIRPGSHLSRAPSKLSADAIGAKLGPDVPLKVFVEPNSAGSAGSAASGAVPNAVAAPSGQISAVSVSAPIGSTAPVLPHSPLNTGHQPSYGSVLSMGNHHQYPTVSTSTSDTTLPVSAEASVPLSQPASDGMMHPEYYQPSYPTQHMPSIQQQLVGASQPLTYGAWTVPATDTSLRSQVIPLSAFASVADARSQTISQSASPLLSQQDASHFYGSEAGARTVVQLVQEPSQVRMAGSVPAYGSLDAARRQQF